MRAAAADTELAQEARLLEAASPNARALLASSLVSLIIIAGCTPAQTKGEGEGGGTKDREIASLKAQLDEQTRARGSAEAQLEDSRRENVRVGRELQATRETADASHKEARAAEEMLLAQGNRFKKVEEGLRKTIADLTNPNDTAPVGSIMVADSPEPRGNSLARLKPLDQDAPVALVEGQEPVSRREFMEWLFYNFVHERLDQYLNYVLVHREAKKLGVVVTDDEVERAATEHLIAISKEAGGDGPLNKKLVENGLTQENILDVLRVNARTTATISKLCFAWRKTPDGKKHMDEKLRDVYLQQYGPKASVRHLYIPMRPGSPEEEWKGVTDLARGFTKQLEAGEDPKKITANAEKDFKRQVIYDARPFTKLTAARFPEIDKAVFEGETGKYQEPVRSALGVSVLYVDNRTAAVASFEEKRAQLELDLVKPDTLSPGEEQQLYADLRAKAKIEKKVDFK
ncbi:hypothetical protein HY251_20755 [bacterium]|nr:hypothetical protein [bacterium]